MGTKKELTRRGKKKSTTESAENTEEKNRGVLSFSISVFSAPSVVEKTRLENQAGVPAFLRRRRRVRELSR